MPASRKRNKGKERKARKVETEKIRLQKVWRNWALGSNILRGNMSIECDHGCNNTRDIISTLSDDHPVSTFICEFAGDWFPAYDKNMLVYLRGLFKEHSQVWCNESYRRMAIQILTSIGINWIIQQDHLENMLSSPGCLGSTTAYDDKLAMATIIVVLENYHDDVEDIDTTILIQAAAKIRNLQPGTNSSMRDALKFYYKRTSCSCLKALYSKARKTIRKVSRCVGCEQEHERVLLSLCSRCRMPHYCSRECQVADWPRHKDYCNYVVDIHNRGTASAVCGSKI